MGRGAEGRGCAVRGCSLHRLSGARVGGPRVRGYRLVVRAQGSGFKCLGFRVAGRGYDLPGFGSKVQPPAFMLHASGFRVHVSRFTLQGSRFQFSALVAADSRP
eukprot:3589466-Rhodomonas_salina.1